MNWVLILYIYAGGFAKGDSVTLTSVPGFSSQSACQVAGNAAAPLVANSVKELRFVCLKQ
jgi:hypothetical protein